MLDSLFFIVSKLAWAFLSPGNLMVFAFALGTTLLVFNKLKAAKRVLMPSALISFMVMAYPVSDFLMMPLESRFSTPNPMPPSIDGIIVLGGGEDLKRSLSWNVAELGLGGDRYIGAAKLAQLYPNAPVIFSGGSGSMALQNTQGEGALANTLLTTIGVAQERLILESKSRNTFENFALLKPLLPKLNGTYLLVTSAFHMPRAVGIARQQGVNVIAYPVDYHSNTRDYRTWDFDLYDHLKALEPAWKEWIGLTVYYATGKTNEWLPAP
ncbi:YdcF family protein [Thiomicrorhabdus aquaedulcis]|uniref:YdcF family protein n=1 Tax=Thiomicrorhabdus aquaedulcis TaxID=2211106 RepID=UPI000FDA2053|nr:YdcF family protein [Thiomicrorhabdus aquaedulcis]